MPRILFESTVGGLLAGACKPSGQMRTHTQGSSCFPHSAAKWRNVGRAFLPPRGDTSQGHAGTKPWNAQKAPDHATLHEEGEMHEEGERGRQDRAHWTALGGRRFRRHSASFKLSSLKTQENAREQRHGTRGDRDTTGEKRGETRVRGKRMSRGHEPCARKMARERGFSAGSW